MRDSLLRRFGCSPFNRAPILCRSAALAAAAMLAVGSAVAAPPPDRTAAAPAGAKAGASVNPPTTRPEDAELKSLGRKVGQKLGSLSAMMHRGPAQDVEYRVTVRGVKAEPVGGATPGATMHIDLEINAVQLQGGDFADFEYAIDADLRRDGDKWTCVKAMATPGMVNTQHSVEAPTGLEEPINVTGDVQRALIAIGAAESPVPKLRQAVVDWVSDNNSFGPGAPIAADMGKLVEKSLVAGQDVGLLMGPGLMKSGKATRVGIISGQLYVVQYTDAQTRASGLKPNSIVKTTVLSSPREVPPDVTIGEPDFGPGPIDLADGIRGTVRAEATRNLPKGDYVVRLSYTAGGHTYNSYDHYGFWKKNKDKRIAFKFDRPPAAEAAKQAGPLVVFLDICQMNDDGNGGKVVEVISPTVAAVVDLKPADAAAR